MSSSRALSSQPQPESGWTIVSGPLAGSQVRMAAAQFSIGRSHECDISLPQDPKISRKHARVYWDGQGFHVQSLVSQNPVLIEGRPVSDSEIHSGTVIQLGDSQLRFEAPSNNMMAGAAPHLAPVPRSDFPAQAPSPHIKRSRKRKQKGSPLNLKRILIYGSVIGVLIWLITPSDKKKVNHFEIRTEQQIEADIQEANELREIAEKMRAERLNPSVQERNAQEHYVKGFRDFRKGQFERSISSFQACLALNPDHPLCNRYLKLSQKKFGELIQYHMILGRKYRDQNQFRACRSAFRNVMVMVKDPSNSIYTEAKSNYVACNSLVEGRF